LPRIDCAADGANRLIGASVVPTIMADSRFARMGRALPFLDRGACGPIGAAGGPQPGSDDECAPRPVLDRARHVRRRRGSP